ncbi:MAG: hypothetical protein KDD54_02895 [Flavobacteriales bacterium]|nr:hypothetical protein [Flavobacteriales bacterium]
MTRHGFFKFILIFGVLTAWASCKKSTVDPPLTYTDYYPVDVGHWVIYDMDSTVYDAFLNGADTNYHYQIKEVIADVFKDNTGQTTYRIERFKRQADTDPWLISDVWYANRFDDRLERVEENLRYVRLQFPPRKNHSWDGNAMNTLETWNYRYTAVHQSYTVGTFDFDSTVTVQQVDEANLIEEKSVEEVYALHVGMVRKTYRVLDKEVDGTIKGGLDYTMTLLDWSE